MSSRLKLLRKQNTFYCGHCNEILCRAAYWKHRKAYYNVATNTWITKASVNAQIKNKESQLQSKRKSNARNCNLHDYVWSSSSSGDEAMEAADPILDQNCLEVPELQVMPDEDTESEEMNKTDQDNSGSNQLSSESSSDNNDEETASEQEPEIWNEDTEGILRDIDVNAEPLPEPRQKKSLCVALTSLLQWFVCFLLFWQSICKISDNGLEWLLSFLFHFLHSLGLVCNNEYLLKLAMMFPSSLYLLRQFVKLDRDDFVKYAVCPECSKIYHLDECTIHVGNQIQAQTCTNKPFRKGRTRECGAVLARKYVTAKRETIFYPKKVYCFKSVINQLESILKRPGLPDLCEKWRRRQVESGVMADIYDGKIWKEFQVVNGKDFLKSERNLALAMNVDWFQPYKRRKDRSVGVIYLVLLNLPREERYKWENVIVAGIIPEMKKEPKSLNTFLDPIVDELKGLWKGIRIQTSASSIPLQHRAALLLAASDIPASRKLCGFKGHSAHRGCSRCFKLFPSTFSTKADYSGFDVKHWPSRDIRTHRIQAMEVKNARNLTQQKKLSKKYGVYYSSLLKLEYFDAIRFNVVDPMHNLFLGTAKRMFKLWLTEEILDKKALQVLEERIESFDVPTGFGRLPKNILSNYGCYTASQWKNWTLIYSTYCLNGLLPESHFRCWQTFVLACQYMSRPVISDIDITRASGLFVKFGQQFEQVCGKKFVTPNMHLHCHLKECVIDFGPVHVFWCFSFERFNGILGATPMNARSIEVQLMRKLLSGKFVYNTTMPTEFQETFQSFFQHPQEDIKEIQNPTNALYFCKSAGCHNLGDIDWSNLSLVSLPKCYQNITLDNDDLNFLLTCYKALYPNLNNLARNCLAIVCRKYAYICLGTEKFGSRKENRSLRSSRVMASWAGDHGTIEPSSFTRPGQVKFYIQHSITVNGTTRQHVLSCVQWHKKDDDVHLFGKPSQVWKKEFDMPGPAVFMPVQRIAHTFATCFVRLNRIDKLVVCPIERLYH